MKDYVIDDNYDDALAIAKQKGRVIGNPISSTPNNYGGNNLAYIRTTKAGGKIVVNILEHMTGHPARGMSTHLNVMVLMARIGIFFLGGNENTLKNKQT